MRSNKRIPDYEFGNLVGRAGRPGFGVEGRSLVLFKPHTNQEGQYKTLINQLRQTYNPLGRSPLAELLKHLFLEWKKVSNSEQETEFFTWLEQTNPITDNETSTDLIETLDSLDAILLAAIVEAEELAQQELSLTELEEKLRHVWQTSFACYADHEQQILESRFIKRGIALQQNIYPDKKQRRQFYRTSLPPRSANVLIQLYEKREFKQLLETGRDYADWNDNQRFEFIESVVKHLTSLHKFKLKEPPNKTTWQVILRWWFQILHEDAVIQECLFNKAEIISGDYQSPKKGQVSEWHAYINQNFIYRFNWGLGSIIALAVEETFGGEFPELEAWPQTGLPWIIFWLKELITWGTVNPVAAYLLAKHMAVTRKEAKELAKEYYTEYDYLPADERLNAKTIQDWTQKGMVSQYETTSSPLPSSFPVYLVQNFSDTAQGKKPRVVPVERENEIYWYDLAGYQLARCVRLANWQSGYLDSYDFNLDLSEKEILCKPYI